MLLIQRTFQSLFWMLRTSQSCLIAHQGISDFSNVISRLKAMSLETLSLVNGSSFVKYVGQIVNIPITAETNRTESVQLISLMNSFRAELSYQ